MVGRNFVRNLIKDTENVKFFVFFFWFSSYVSRTKRLIENIIVHNINVLINNFFFLQFAHIKLFLRLIGITGFAIGAGMFFIFNGRHRGIVCADNGTCMSKSMN